MAVDVLSIVVSSLVSVIADEPVSPLRDSAPVELEFFSPSPYDVPSIRRTMATLCLLLILISVVIKREQAGVICGIYVGP